jgi:hypothetical protein
MHIRANIQSEVHRRPIPSSQVPNRLIKTLVVSSPRPTIWSYSESMVLHHR